MSIPITPAQLLSQQTYDQPGKLRVTEYTFTVPLSYNNPTGSQLRLFGRGVSKLEAPLNSSSKPTETKPTPWIAYLQGGPGFGCGEPQNSGFTQYLLDKGYQLLLLDQRGFGLSHTLTAETVWRSYPDPPAAAKYLSHFRADNSVRDFEAVRRCLTADTKSEEDRKWSIIGQSYGGFMATTYLSFYPQGLREAFICGGVPPVGKRPDEVYERLYERLESRSYAYYSRYPSDAVRVKRIVRHLQQRVVVLPDGSQLIPERFMSLGVKLGMHNGPTTLHAIITRAYFDLQTFSLLTRPTLVAIEDSSLAIDNAIAYALLHEPLYLDGPSAGASNWAALRVKPSSFRIPDLKNMSDADIQKTDGQAGTQTGKLCFTAEQVLPSIVEASGELGQMRDVAEILAKKSDWPPLYDIKQLEKNAVPIYALVYIDDLYVDVELSNHTLTEIIGVRNGDRTKKPKYRLTNGFWHNALGNKSEKAIAELWALRDDVTDLDI